MNILEKAVSTIRKWLKLDPPQPKMLMVQEQLTFTDNAAVNRIWYRGDPDELTQLYGQLGGWGFWSASKRAKVRKIHTGLPKIIVKTLSQIVVADLLDITCENEPVQQQIWDEIAEDNDFMELLETAIRRALYIGDGAFRITYDPGVSEYPLLEFVHGDRISYTMHSGRITQVQFHTCYSRDGKQYYLQETYGFGYVRYRLEDAYGNVVPLETLSETAGLADIVFSEDICLAVPLKFYQSERYPGRGESIFDEKRGNFDAADEAWSQWMQAVRKSQPKTYVPSNIAPWNAETCEPQQPDPFEDTYIVVGSSMGENDRSQISSVQPSIAHEGYQAAYITALDLCLQGIISPSTLGIDVKKLDNAEAQREKEKATLYTRNHIVAVLQKTLPKLVESALYLYSQEHELSEVSELKVTVGFGEYANPSFEAQVETVGKAKQQGIMSTEAAVDELYGDTKSDAWKQEEVRRLREEHGMVSVEETEVF